MSLLRSTEDPIDWKLVIQVSQIPVLIVLIRSLLPRDIPYVLRLLFFSVSVSAIFLGTTWIVRKSLGGSAQLHAFLSGGITATCLAIVHSLGTVGGFKVTHIIGYLVAFVVGGWVMSRNVARFERVRDWWASRSLKGTGKRLRNG